MLVEQYKAARIVEESYIKLHIVMFSFRHCHMMSICLGSWQQITL